MPSSRWRKLPSALQSIRAAQTPSHPHRDPTAACEERLLPFLCPSRPKPRPRSQRYSSRWAPLSAPLLPPQPGPAAATRPCSGAHTRTALHPLLAQRDQRLPYGGGTHGPGYPAGCVQGQEEMTPALFLIRDALCGFSTASPPDCQEMPSHPGPSFLLALFSHSRTNRCLCPATFGVAFPQWTRRLV